MPSATRRIARETWQRASDALANKETEDAEFTFWLRGGQPRIYLGERFPMT